LFQQLVNMFGRCALNPARNFKLEFKMLAFPRPASIILAVMLGVALDVQLAVPAFSDSAPPKAAAQSVPANPLHNGDLVRVRSGGPLMTVTAVQGDQVNCAWTDWNGELKTESFPIAVLSVPITIPAEDPGLERDERAADQYYKKHCPSGSVSRFTGKFECAF
jgi:uncharacterized protein YodC (DUF2158 family)